MNSAEPASPTPASTLSTAEASGAHRLSFFEKAGYSAADAAANFVFMTMILFQTNFYTDVFGLDATIAAAILLWPRLWDAVADPIVGILADRTNTRWGKFRPWVIGTAVPWFVVMILAYSTPHGWSKHALVVYAAITNTLLMSIYSMNNMPYAALGGVMTGDINERAKLNSFRFIAVNAAQFIVGGFTLPLVAKFAAKHANGAEAALADKQYGWQWTMTIWAVLCLILFIITFVSTRERIKPMTAQGRPPKEDFADLIKNHPWWIMFFMTLFHFCILSFRGGAQYDYFMHYADKPAMYDFLSKLGLVVPAGVALPDNVFSKLGETLGYIVHGDRTNIAGSNAAAVFFSIISMTSTGVTIIVILLSAPLAKTFGKKVVAAAGFSLATLNAFAFYLLPKTAVTGMFLLTVTGAIVYAPTIALIWAIYADVADYSEWKTGHRFTGIVFATIGFGLKSGLALGSASLLWILAGCFNYHSLGIPEFAKGDANHVASILNVPALVQELKTTNAVSEFVKGQLSDPTKQALAGYQDSAANQAAMETVLLADLNKIVAGPSIYDENRFANVKLDQSKEWVSQLAKLSANKKQLEPFDQSCFNRALLHDAYPKSISANWRQTEDAVNGFRFCYAIVVGCLFAICSVLLFFYPLGKRITLQMADELAARRLAKAKGTTA
jgi:glycoside/pentoside/hexuronide:cation symporter, GPH family